MFTAQLQKEVEPIIEAIYEDDFIQDLIHNRLDKESVKHYLKADSRYLKEFAKIYSLLIEKIDDEEGIKFLLEQIDFVINGEIEAHQTMADYVGEAYTDIIKDGDWYPASDHYIKHMYYNAFKYSEAAYTICAMAPCPYVYERVAHLITERHDLTGNPLKPWVDFYTKNMSELMAHLNKWVDEYAEQAGEKERMILRKNFIESCIHERRFFQMSYDQSTWEDAGAVNV